MAGVGGKPGMAGPDNGVLACPERCLERQRGADVLGDPAVWRQAERAEQDPVLPDGVGQPIAGAVHRVQDRPPPGAGSQQAAGQLRGTAGHHVAVAQNVNARETARVDDPIRRVDVIAQRPSRADGQGTGPGRVAATSAAVLPSSGGGAVRSSSAGLPSA